MPLDARSSGTLYKLAAQCLEDSERWFGDTGASRSISHMVLALCGEVGELANLTKKVDRGSINSDSALFKHDFAMELADILTYLLNISGMIGIDLEAAYHVKRDYNHERFTAARDARELAHLGDAGPVGDVRSDDSGAPQDGS